MMNFIDFIRECERPGGGVLLREYLATQTLREMTTFFVKNNFYVVDNKPEEEELAKLWDAKERAKYLCIDYEYINGKGMSY
jgi:hypothetical protein